jgi:hypothetical protein
MKMNFKMFIVLMVGVLFFTACTKETVPPPPVDENYWLQKERAVVVYTDFNCDLYIVQTRTGYAVIRNWNGFTPFTGEVLYGDFSRWGTIEAYNRSTGRIITVQVRENWLTWFEARDYVSYYCGR